MNKITILCSFFVTLLMPTSVLAGIKNVRYLHQNENNTFNVICLDGSLETVNTQAIINNSICHNISNPYTPSKPNTPSKPKFICTGDNFFDRYYVTRISDGKKFGDHSPLKTCKRILNGATDDLICIGDNFFDRYYVTRISDGKKFGDHSPLKTCLRLINDNQ
ncbi:MULTISPECIES: hypothetical protein [unclassified Moorena]|uniref:hypothetical protein n=1 Tax=unclassified Moorena TaxID=2683338 RepID=UPI0013FEFA5E|nr:MULTISPECIES: hypothetical protein [unclassified Moorena]NEO17125.1 hypothetical protein [Moorena sp. SIO3E8]NEQ03404.1 hypothetical protein [Moorena sp. SIO3F7]